MFIEMKRAYSKKRRAQSEEDTRARIAEATMALHEEIGPAATTISAIAERAGVQRLTVYRHFPTEADIFEACTSLWNSRNPPPALEIWADAADPSERVRKGLTALYAFYRSAQGMLRSILRDRGQVALADRHMGAFDKYLEAVAADLIGAFPRGGARRERTLRHAVKFQTWDSLAADGASDSEIAELVVSWLRGEPAFD